MSFRRWSLARQVFALTAAALTLVVAVALAAAYAQARAAALDSARAQALAVAKTVAESPQVRSGMTSSDPSATLQPYAQAVKASSGTDFVVLMDPRGIRWTHPNPALIGQPFQGHIDPAVRGQDLTETYTGTLGPSVRAVVPVYGMPGTPDAGRIVGLAAVGITLETVGRSLSRQIPVLLLAALVALVVTGVVLAALSRRLRRQTHGLGPDELRRMYEYYDAVLHAVREGLILLGRGGRIELANDEARRLLGLPDDAVGRGVRDVGLPDGLAQALADDVERADEVHLAGDHVLVVNQAQAVWEGRRLGTVVTLRDRTDLLALSGELDSVKGLAESLRSQAHEAANRLHAVVSLIELGRPDRALEFATAQLVGAQELTDRVVESVQEPVLAALLLGKAAQAAERGIDLELEELAVPAAVAEAFDPADLVTIVGNLLDNAMEAVASTDPPRRVAVRAAVDRNATDGVDGADGGAFVLTVTDSGPGLDPEDVERAFRRGWSTKAGGGLVGRGIGLALVGQTVHRCGGSVHVERGHSGGAVFTVRLPLGARARTLSS